LFYYVARFGGISEAVRKMPYGIQQPAVSGQILQLEDRLGVTLFRRRPFALTAAGVELYAYVEPFFSRLDEMEKRVSGGSVKLVRVVSSSLVLKEQLPPIFERLRAREANVKISLRDALHSEVFHILERNEADFAISLLDGKSGTGLKTHKLLELSLVLLVSDVSPVRSAEEIFKSDKIQQSLIGLPAKESVSKVFLSELSKRKIDWPVGIEVGSLDMIEPYVASGFGVGVSVCIPGRIWSAGIRAILLEDFPKISVGVCWSGALSEVHQSFLDECIAYADSLLKSPKRRSTRVSK
jgi:DNA-binding transcriptional LysR family regulator